MISPGSSRQGHPHCPGHWPAAAVEYLQKLGMDAVWAHEQDLVRYALEQMRQVHDLELTDLRQRSAVGSSPLTSKDSIRTIWPRFWTTMVWPFAPGITVLCP